MTEKDLRNHVVSTAKKYMGCRESDGSHRKIIDTYNNHRPLARSYAVRYTDAWCATFVSAVAILCGLTDIIFTECGCGQMIELFKAKGRWKEADGHVPEPGDIIMYYWNDSGSGDCTGWPDHVGIVTSVSGNVIKVIEGNKADAVGERTMRVNGKYIRGYCLPDYASKADNHEIPKDNQVIVIDGYSLKSFIIDVQRACGANVDGIAGAETLAKTVTLSATKNRTHAVVKAVQMRLNDLGYTDVGKADGIAGAKFTEAVKQFQRDHQCEVDGEITAKHKTWCKLLGLL